MTEEFDQLMNTDPFLEAEKITGKSYKEDKATEGLGFLMHIAKTEAVRDEMLLRDDTYYSSKYEDAQRIIGELGFERIYVQELFEEKYPTVPVEYAMYWRKGVLLVLESYDGGGPRGRTVNHLNIYGNWKSNDPENAWGPVGGSGHMTRHTEGYDTDPEDPWVFTGDFDARTGLRNLLEKMDAAGTWLETWIETPFIHFVSYAEKGSREEGFDYKFSSWNKIAQFPPEIRDMIAKAEGHRSKRRGK